MRAMQKPSYTYQSRLEKKKEKMGKVFYQGSRIFDNHYDPQVHTQPWISGGKQPDHHWIYDDSGLVPDMSKAKKYGDEDLIEQKKVEVERRLQKMRKFKEYELIQEDEYLITIEYSTKCHFDGFSTRHNDKKYARIANKIKLQILQNFPNCQVLLKPLIIQKNDASIENLYLKKRLGCCEVQLCHKKRGQQQQINYTLFKLHSKLETKTWPRPSRIIQKLQMHMPKFIFYVQVQIKGFEKY